MALGDNNTFIPPDTTGSVGPNHLMTTLNSQVLIQNRTGATAVPAVSLANFWASIGISPFDPRVIFDPYNSRWISTACDNSNTTTPAGFLIAVSQTNDPTGTWFLYRVATLDANWMDYDNVGFNKDWIAVTVNKFDNAGKFHGSEIYAFNKAALYAGATAPYKLFTSSGFTWVPAMTFDNSLNTLYLLSVYDSATGRLHMATITGALGSETFTESSTAITSSLGGWTGSSVSGADFAPQLGSTNKIDNGDDRIQNVVYRNGMLWTTHTIFLPPGGVPARSSVQWWQITPGTTPSLAQMGRIDDATGVNFYAYPSLAVNKNNDVLIGFASFSASQYASGAYAFRNSSDPPGTMRSNVLLKAGEAPYYKTYGGANNRWGDYSFTSIDPLNDTDFWTIQEYAWTHSTLDRWSTWWGHITPPPAAFYKSTPTNGTTNLTGGSVTLTWGASDGAVSYDYCLQTTNTSACSTWVPNTGLNPTSVTVLGLAANTPYYWQVRADNAISTTEADGGTWWSFTTGNTLPDLVVTGLSIVRNPAPLSQPLQITVTIQNQGTLDVSQAFSTALFLDHGPTGCADPASLTTWSTTTLAAGQSLALAFTYSGFSAVGSHAFLAYVDSACQVTETTKVNNTLSHSLFAGYAYYFPFVSR